MQLLIDVSQETPDSLLLASEILKMLSAAMVPVEKPASINGPSTPIVLYAHGPAAPIDPRPQASIDLAQLDPAAMFGRGVPARTIPLAPPAPTAPNATNVVPISAFRGLP